MIDPKLGMLSYERLVDNLSKSLKDYESSLDLGRFWPAITWQDGLKHGMQASLKLNNDESSIFDMTSDNVGYVFVHKNMFLEEPYENPISQERVILGITTPIELSKGRISESRMALLAENTYEKNCFSRQDYIQDQGIFRREVDLSKTVPTEWFMRETPADWFD